MGAQAQEKRQITKRTALILCSKTIADCPINAACISTDEETKKRTMCGHYAGSHTDINGSQIYCVYQD